MRITRAMKVVVQNRIRILSLKTRKTLLTKHKTTWLDNDNYSSILPSLTFIIRSAIFAISLSWVTTIKVTSCSL